MKKLHRIVVAIVTVVLLVPAGGAYAFDAGEIAFGEFRTVGTAKQKIDSTRDYMGAGYHTGYMVELNGTIKGVTEISPDYAGSIVFGLTAPYYCDVLAEDYDWNEEKNRLTDTDTIVRCYDKIGQAPPYPDPFIDVADCTLVLNFSSPSGFSGKLKCIDGDNDYRFVGKITGTRMGTYNPLVFQTAQ